MPRIRIEVVEGPHSRRDVHLVKPIVTIGRGSQCDLRVEGDAVSSQHAKLRIYATHAVVQDAGSLNGVLVDGQPISGSADIGQGSVIQLGPGGPTLRIVDGLPTLAAASSSYDAGSGGYAAAPTNPTRGSNTFLWVVATLAGMLVLASCGAMIVGLTWYSTHASKQRIASLQDEQKLAQAIGLVLNGVEISGKLVLRVPVKMGTAFAISPDGYLATNSHVIGELSEVDAVRRLFPGAQVRQVLWVSFNGNVTLAKVVRSSSDPDFALLKVAKTDMPYFRLSNAKSLPRRSDVFALGFPGAASIPLTSEEDLQVAMKDDELHSNVTSYFKPRDLDYSMTKGIISKVISDPDGGIWLQHDTAISHGNSGGPLCLDDGTVVAINTRINPETAGNSFSFVISQLREEIDSLSKNSDWVD